MLVNQREGHTSEYFEELLRWRGRQPCHMGLDKSSHISNVGFIAMGIAAEAYCPEKRTKQREAGNCIGGFVYVYVFYFVHECRNLSVFARADVHA